MASIAFKPITLIGQTSETLFSHLEESGFSRGSVEKFITEAPGYYAYHDETGEVVGFIIGSSERYAERPMLFEKYRGLVLSGGEHQFRACVLMGCAVSKSYEKHGVMDELMRLFVEEASLHNLHAHVLAQVTKERESLLLETLTQKGFAPFSSDEHFMCIWLSRPLTASSKCQTEYRRISLEEGEAPGIGTW